MALEPGNLEREFNPRVAVPDHPRIFQRWEKDSAYVCGTLEARLGLAYGADPRQSVDVFPARNPRATLVFIHGGYWRALDKRLFAWIAPPFVAAGISVANVGYRLCPQVRIDDIIDDVIGALNFVVTEGHAPGPVVVAGHSAGGHLVAAILSAPHGRFTFDVSRIVGGVPISGVFDLTPLPQVSVNADLRLEAADAERLSMMKRSPSLAVPLVVAVGGDETAAFVGQSRDFARSPGWAPQVRALLDPPGYHHFSILDALIERGQALHQQTLGLFQ